MPLKIRRGPESQRLSITPTVAEPIYTTDTKQVYMGDGTTPGGNLMFIVKEVTFSTSTTTPNQAVHSVPVSGYTSVKYVAQVANGDERQVSEIRVFHNETTAFITEYGVMFSTENRLALFDADISEGNLRLLVTPQQGGLTTFQLHSQALRK